MVTIHRCESYQTAPIEEALQQILQDMGGFEPYIQPGETVLLKTNLLLAKGPERAATVHPSLVLALAKALVQYGCKVFIGDSPGGPFNGPALRVVYRVTGMAEVAKEAGAELSYDTDTAEISYPDGERLKRITVTSMSQKVDKVISVCKLKTHSMMIFTGAAKNMFGVIPGTMKAEYHVRMPIIEDFAEALLDICQAVRPVLSFMDAVIGMEGNGPSNGSPRKIGALLASSSPYELDMVAANIIGLAPEQVPLLKAAYGRGLIPASIEEIQTAGDAREEFAIADYKLPDHIHTNLEQGGFLPKFLMKRLRPKVRFDEASCVGCGDCAANCPAKVITMQQDGKKRRPVVDYHQCIRCYCCQELCPKGAVHVKESKIFKLANRI